jgi:hypothetical protein
LLNRFHLDIHFAHRTFAWQSEARGKAHVHVVIIGFASFPGAAKTLFEYHTPTGEATAMAAVNINPYLADAPNTLVLKRTTPVNGAPEISYGSMANDRFLFALYEKLTAPFAAAMAARSVHRRSRRGAPPAP